MTDSLKQQRDPGDNRTLKIGPPARMEDELFEDYKLRRKAEAESLKVYLRGYTPLRGKKGESNGG